MSEQWLGGLLWLHDGRCGLADGDGVDDLERTGPMVDLERVIRHPPIDVVVRSNVSQHEEVVVARIENDAAMVVIDADRASTVVLLRLVSLEVNAFGFA